MRFFWTLPRLAPLLFRHFGGYVELAAWDLAQSLRDLLQGLVVAVVVGVSVFFTLLMACIAVLALTWDGPHRVAAIAWMGGTFLLIALVSIWYRSSRARLQPEFLGTVRREWSQDVVLFDRLLSEEDGEERREPPGGVT